MSYFYLARTRNRTRSPSPPPIPKRSRTITLDDPEDTHDDYPYSPTHRRPSRALSLHKPQQPSTLERYNIWSDKRNSTDLAIASGSSKKEWDRERDLEIERVKTIRRDGRHRHRHRHRHYDKGEEEEEEEEEEEDRVLATDPDEASFRLKIQARFGHSPRLLHHHHHHHHADVIDCKDRLDGSSEQNHHDKWRSVSRERRHGLWGDSFWDDEDVENVDFSEAWWEDDSWSRYRKMKKIKTEEEWRPLVGWRRR